MIRTISTSAAASSLLISNHAVNLQRVEGFFVGQSQVPMWLQLHAGAAVPPDTTRPAYRSLYLQPNYPFYWGYPNQQVPLGLPRHVSSSCILVVSSTEATLTASTDTADIWCDVEEWEESPNFQTTVAGDLTTGVDSLQVWAQAAGPKALQRLDMTNTTSDTLYAWLFVDDAMTVPFGRPIEITGNSTVTARFGDCLGTFPGVASVANGRLNGLTVAFSSTITAFTATVTQPGTIKAAYLA